MADELPREIIDKIVGNIEDKHDLMRLSLVSSVWPPSTRPPLFTSIFITGDWPRGGYQAVMKFLRSKPKLRPLIKNLRLSRGCFSEAYLSWEVLDALLSQLPAIQFVHLHRVRFERSEAANVAAGGMHSLQTLANRSQSKL